MMGERTVAQEALFYSFNLERHVPTDHLLRSIDRFVDLSGIREHLRPYYSETGRPSIDPELMIRMLLIGYCMGIRSERARREDQRCGPPDRGAHRGCGGDPCKHGSLPGRVRAQHRRCQGHAAQLGTWPSPPHRPRPSPASHAGQKAFAGERTAELIFSSFPGAGSSRGG